MTIHYLQPVVDLINAGKLKYVVPQLLTSLVHTFGALVKALLKDEPSETVNMEG